MSRLKPDRHNSLIRHLDGVPWHEAPRPWRGHKCWIQTVGWISTVSLTEVARCSCGAICLDPGRPGRRIWLERNSRRKASRKR